MGASSLDREGPDWVWASAELGASIRAARGAKRVTQGELAGLVGLTQPAISQLERGVWKKVRRGVLQEIGAVLALEASALWNTTAFDAGRLGAGLRDALAPMADRSAAEQADLGAVIRSLIAWRYGVGARPPKPGAPRPGERHPRGGGQR